MAACSTSITRRSIVGGIWVEGIDLDVSYRLDTALGAWSPSFLPLHAL